MEGTTTIFYVNRTNVASLLAQIGNLNFVICETDSSIDATRLTSELITVGFIPLQVNFKKRPNSARIKVWRPPVSVQPSTLTDWEIAIINSHRANSNVYPLQNGNEHRRGATSH